MSCPHPLEGSTAPQHTPPTPLTQSHLREKLWGGRAHCFCGFSFKRCWQPPTAPPTAALVRQEIV